MPYIDISGRLINLDNFDEIIFDIFLKHIILRKICFTPKDNRYNNYERGYYTLRIDIDRNINMDEIKKEILHFQNGDINEKANKKIKKLEKKVKELEQAILYQPGGEIYQEAKQDFEDKS